MEHTTTALPKSFLAFYDTPKEVENAIIQLQKNKCDLGKLSIVAINLSTDQTNATRVNLCRMSYRALAGGIFGLIIGCSVILALSIKPFFTLGTVNMILILVEMAVTGAMVSILIAMLPHGLSRIENSNSCMAKIKAGKYLILSSGDDREIETEKQILNK